MVPSLQVRKERKDPNFSHILMWVSLDLLVKILGLLIKVIIYRMVVIWMKQAYQSLRNGLMALYLGRIIK